MCVCVSVSAFDCPHLDLCPYVRDLCVKLFASPFMRACADLLVCKSASVVCVCVCVCLSVCVCVLEVTHAGKRGRGKAPIYIGSYTRGNELTSKRACS